jgi:hypothetical protein
MSVPRKQNLLDHKKTEISSSTNSNATNEGFFCAKTYLRSANGSDVSKFHRRSGVLGVNQLPEHGQLGGKCLLSVSITSVYIGKNALSLSIDLCSFLQQLLS